MLNQKYNDEFNRFAFLMVLIAQFALEAPRKFCVSLSSMSPIFQKVFFVINLKDFNFIRNLKFTIDDFYFILVIQL